jgi:hypothetical protein
MPSLLSAVGRSGRAQFCMINYFGLYAEGKSFTTSTQMLLAGVHYANLLQVSASASVYPLRVRFEGCVLGKRTYF